MSLPVVDGEALRRLLPWDAATAAVESMFRGPPPVAPPRSRLEVPGGELLLMPSAGVAGAGVKLVTIAPSNPARGLPLIHASYVLFDPDSLAPVALLDGEALTAMRTAAVTALATRLLARPASRRVVLFGAGVQARAHLDALLATFPIDDVRVVSRTVGRAEELVALAHVAGVSASVAEPGSVADADVVCTCTTSTEPLFDGDLLPRGAHVNAIGAYRPDIREVDDATVRRARVVVETRETAMAEAGDLLIPIERGIVDPSHVVADLGEVVRGTTVRRDDEDITLFKSVGVAFEDLAVARAVADRLETAGGTPR